MSDFNYYYTSGYKGRGSDILDALRQKDDQTKAEAIDFLIDRGYLHSEEMYNAAYVNALGDYLGISDYDPDEYDEYNAPVSRGTKHSSLDEVHQRLRESGKKRRQQRIAQARRMKQGKFEAEGTVRMKIEYEWWCDFYDDEDGKLYKDYKGYSQDDRMKIEDLVKREIEFHLASGDSEGYYPNGMAEIGWSDDEGSYQIGYEFHLAHVDDRVVFDADMEMTPDIMDYPGLPVVPDSYGTNSALDSGNGVPVWYGSAESNRGYGQLRYDARFDRDQTGEQDFLQNYYVRYTVYDNDKTYNDLPQAYKTVFNEMIKADLQSNFDTLWMDDDEDLRNFYGEIEYVGPSGEEVVIDYEASLSPPQILSEKLYPDMSQSSYEFGVNFKGETLRGKDSVVTTNTSWKPSKGKKNMEHRFTPSRAFMDYAKVTKEAPFAGAGSLFKFGGNDSALGGFTAKELTESSSIHGDFDHASLNYSGKQNIEARAESANPTGGATGDQIVSWEHNGLSSPSGPPSDIFWSEELDAEGYGDVQKYVSIDFTWDYSGEHEDAVSDGDYYITDQIKDLVESEVESGEYSGSGWYSYTVEIEDDKGEITEEDVDIDYSWG
ncbi:MAG: hypothetical protein ACTSPB_05060 [Candidatus Thorarchaeota archaeon]